LRCRPRRRRMRALSCSIHSCVRGVAQCERPEILRAFVARKRFAELD
jgi:hypothetical protein